MKIIIAGAGEIGFHIAESLSLQNHDITLIDNNQDVLDYADLKLDVITLKGDSSSVSILKNAGVAQADIMLSVTTSEKNNIVTAILAKNMGAKKTIARVRNTEYLAKHEKKVFFKLGVDTLISPNQLAAREIQRLMRSISFTDMFEFSEGQLQMIGLTVNEHNDFVNRTVKDLGQTLSHLKFRMIALLRNDETTIPYGDLTINEGDHIYFIVHYSDLNKLLNRVGVRDKKIGRIMMIGNTNIALQTAKILEHGFRVKIIVKDKEDAKRFAVELPKTLVIHGDPANFDLLKVEDLSRMDAFLALTSINEVNVLTALLAKKKGVKKTVALTDNIDYTALSQSIGVDTLINQKLIAANNIYRFVRKAKIESITSLHGVDAEVIEFIINKPSKITRVPIKDIGLPKQCIIGGALREDIAYIPDGNFKLEVDDHVIIFAMQEAIEELEKIFA